MPLHKQRQYPGVDQIDLSNCDREPIHIPARIQSFGALISVTADWIINHASSNACALLSLPDQDLIGRPLADVFAAEALHALRGQLHMISGPDDVDRLFQTRFTINGPLCDVALHKSGRNIVLEFEHSTDEEIGALGGYVRPMIARMANCQTVEEICQLATRQVKALTRMDRIMVYRFNNDETGTVIAETHDPTMEPFLGLTYPASDIPKQARALYTRNLLRLIADVNDAGVEILPTLNPEGEPLDLSMSVTRAVSPIHLEYLRNMGVGASLSISILRRGKLWGLIACHHQEPHRVSYPTRTALELFAILFGFLLDQRQTDDEKTETLSAQLLHDRIMARLAEDSSVEDNFDVIIEAIKDVIPYDGVVGWINGQCRTVGATPDEDQILRLVRFLNTAASGGVFATNCLARHLPQAADYAETAAGLLALPVSRTPRDYIVLFRREIAKSVRWAGNPEKPVTVGPMGARLTPRKSFEVWRESVRHHCADWTPGQQSAAEALRITMMEVVLRMSDKSLRERTSAQEKQELLIAELNHRVRNILNLIKSVIGQSSASHKDVASFTKVIDGRIHALALAHDQITRENWAPASLYQLIRTEAAAYLADEASRVSITGPDALLQPDAFTSLSLVMHELITNSAKYGALTVPQGRIEIALGEQIDGALCISWREVNGPPVQPPLRRGFGTTIVERSIPYELQGQAELLFALDGVKAEFLIPAKAVHDFTDHPASEMKKPELIRPPASVPQTVLLVEDNIIIGLDAESMLTRLGVETVVIASTVAEALASIERTDFDFAFLDFGLRGETSQPIALKLAEKGVRFAFATGYGDQITPAQSADEIDVIVKPYSEDDLRRAWQPVDTSTSD